ncbi:hypothetical protein [Candidatus Palauibacter sp.]|uniref:hypothetical protein n=1 Tax=Candidatus Palauibacter sp. TaxID=3101350 RepID=UPI003AF2CDBF
MGARPWTEEEDDALLAIRLTPFDRRYEGRGGAIDAAARRLGRTRAACLSRYAKLMRSRGHTGGKWTDEGLWTPEEDDAVRACLTYDGTPVAPGTWPPIAEDLGRSVHAVRARAVHLRRLEAANRRDNRGSVGQTP